MPRILICGNTSPTNRRIMAQAIREMEATETIVIRSKTLNPFTRTPNGVRQDQATTIATPPDQDSTQAMFQELQPDAVAVMVDRGNPPDPDAQRVTEEANTLDIPVRTFTPKAVLVTGGREFKNKAILEQVLDQLQPDIIIHGAARGADTMAGEYAASRGIPCQEYPANWEEHGRTAGTIRNREMLEKSKPDIVVAFPGKSGTRNMTQIAADQGYRVNHVIDSSQPAEKRGSRRKRPTPKLQARPTDSPKDSPKEGLAALVARLSQRTAKT